MGGRQCSQAGTGANPCPCGKVARVDFLARLPDVFAMGEPLLVLPILHFLGYQQFGLGASGLSLKCGRHSSLHATRSPPGKMGILRVVPATGFARKRAAEALASRASVAPARHARLRRWFLPLARVRRALPLCGRRVAWRSILWRWRRTGRWSD